MAQHWQAFEAALDAALEACRPSERRPSFYDAAVGNISSKKLASLASKFSADVLAGNGGGLANVLDALESYGEQLADITRVHRAAAERNPPPIPSQPQEGLYQIEVYSRAVAAHVAVVFACWQRAAADLKQGRGAGGSGGSSAAGECVRRAAEKLEWVLGMWGAACALAMHSCSQGVLGHRRVPDKYIDPVLRVATCTLSALHTALTFTDTLASAAAAPAGLALPSYKFGTRTVVASVAGMSQTALQLVAALAPEDQLRMGAQAGGGNVRPNQDMLRAAAARQPFPAWAHARAVLPFLEQANRLLPLLRSATEGPGRAAVGPAHGPLEDVMMQLATCCTSLSFMLTFQRAQPGEGGAEVERRIASLTATGAKLAWRLEAEGYAGPMLAYINTAMGRGVEWLTRVRVDAAGSTAAERQAALRGMHDPDSKLAALVYVCADVWPLGHRLQLGEAFQENSAMSAALLTNIAGLPMAHTGALKVVAQRLHIAKDSLSMDWLSLLVAALGQAGQTEPELYCWMARDGVCDALAATAAAVAQRPCPEAQRRMRNTLWRAVYDTLLGTARKADELADSRFAEELERFHGELTAQHGGTDNGLSKPAFWHTLATDHLPAIVAALRGAPSAGCQAPSPAEAAVTRDRACAWLGCANPGCITATGPSEDTMPVLRCAGCRLVGCCGAKCQRADWARHKLACTQLRGRAAA